MTLQLLYPSTPSSQKNLSHYFTRDSSECCFALFSVTSINNLYKSSKVRSDGSNCEMFTFSFCPRSLEMLSLNFWPYFCVVMLGRVGAHPAGLGIKIGSAKCMVRALSSLEPCVLSIKVIGNIVTTQVSESDVSTQPRGLFLWHFCGQSTLTPSAAGHFWYLESFSVQSCYVCSMFSSDEK